MACRGSGVRVPSAPQGISRFSQVALTQSWHRPHPAKRVTQITDTPAVTSASTGLQSTVRGHEQRNTRLLDAQGTSRPLALHSRNRTSTHPPLRVSTTVSVLHPTPPMASSRGRSVGKDSPRTHPTETSRDYPPRLHGEASRMKCILCSRRFKHWQGTWAQDCNRTPLQVPVCASCLPAFLNIEDDDTRTWQVTAC